MITISVSRWDEDPDNAEATGKLLAENESRYEGVVGTDVTILTDHNFLRSVTVTEAPYERAGANTFRVPLGNGLWLAVTAQLTNEAGEPV